MGMVMVRVVKHKSYSLCKVPNNLVVSKACQFKYPVSPHLNTAHYTRLCAGIPERNETRTGLSNILLEVWRSEFYLLKTFSELQSRL